MNQFSRPDGYEECLDAYLTRGAMAAEIRSMADVTMKSGLCIVGSSPYAYFRHGGKLRKLAVRALVHRYLNPTEAPVFGPCRCKNKGCVHPQHQNVVEKKNE